MSQILLFSFSIGAIWLLGRKDGWAKWGFVLGLLAQPFWLYSSWKTRSWGIFVLALFYTLAYVKGIINHFKCQ